MELLKAGEGECPLCGWDIGHAHVGYAVSIECFVCGYHSENPKGMGLGLAVVKHIAELHDWRIKAIAQRGGFYLLVELRPR